MRRPQRFGPMHEYCPIFLLLIWKRQVSSSNYPCTPTFDAYVSCNFSQAFMSSLHFTQIPYPKCKEDQQPSNFCLGQEWHPPLHASHLAKLSFCLGVLGRLLTMLHCNWPHLVPLAPFASACIHDQRFHWFSPSMRLSAPTKKIVHTILNADYKQSLCWLLLLCIVLPWTIPEQHPTFSTLYLTLRGTPLELV